MASKIISRSIFRDRNRKGYLFILPYFLVFLLFQLYPIIMTFTLSLSGASGGAETAPGFTQYQRLIQNPIFYKAIANTWYIWMGNFIPQIIVALFLAVVLTGNNIKGKTALRTIYFLPNLVTAASIGVLFAVMLDWNHGTVNQVLLRWGLIDEPVYWLGIPLFAQGAVSLIQWWQWFGYTMIIFMAGLSAISTDMYEAAYIDGAKRGQIFWYITLPLLRPTILYVMITSLIGGLQIFDIPKVLTNGRGAPDNALTTMVLYLYNQAFSNYNIPYAAAVAYSLFIMILLFSFLTFKWIGGTKGASRSRKR